MKKILFISLAVVLALSIGLIGCEGEGEGEPVIPTEPTEIVIGRSVSSTGANAMIHWGAGYPIQTLFEIVVNGDCHELLCGNETCTCTFPEGWGQGLHLKQYDEVGDECYVPIEFKTYDDYSDPGKSVINLVKLITTDEVDFVWGGTGTAMIHAQAAIADNYEMVLPTLEGGATEIKAELIEDLPYLFVNLSFSDWYELPVLAEIMKDNGVDSAFISYIWDQHGFEYLDVATAEFEANDIEVLGTFPMAYDFVAFDEVVSAANATGAELFCAFAYPGQLFPLGPEMVTQQYNPEAIIFGPGSCFGYYPYEGFNDADNAEGIMTFATSNSDTVVSGGTFTADWLFDSVAAIMDPWCETVLGTPPDMGFLMNDYWGHSLYWAMCEMWKTAVEEVGYVSQNLLKDELGSYDSLANGVPTILGTTWYEMFGDGGGILSYKCHTGEIGQWQGSFYQALDDIVPGGVFEGRVEIIGYDDVTSVIPNYKVTGNFTPMKDQWDWLP